MCSAVQCPLLAAQVVKKGREVFPSRTTRTFVAQPHGHVVGFHREHGGQIFLLSAFVLPVVGREVFYLTRYLERDLHSPQAERPQRLIRRRGARFLYI